MDTNPVYFIDMDGVLVRYDRHAYVKSSGPAPNIALFEHEPSHYFRYCEPDRTAISMLEALLAIDGAKTFIMTSVAEHIPWVVKDKKIWLSQHCPYIDIESQVIIACCNKSEMARAKLRGMGIDDLGKSIFLIDDFNPNLIKWEREGGKAVKYLNGVNSPDSWNGLSIDGRSGSFDARSICRMQMT